MITQQFSSDYCVGLVENCKNHRGAELAPYEVVYSWFVLAHPELIKKDKTFGLNIVNEVRELNNYNGTEDFQLWLHYSRESKDACRDMLERNHAKTSAELGTFLEERGYPADVVIGKGITHIFIYGRMNTNLGISIAFMLPLLVPDLFVGKDWQRCEEYLIAAGHIEANDYNTAWSIMSPAFGDLKRKHTLQKTKELFQSVYGEQIKGIRDNIEQHHRDITTYQEQLSYCYESIEKLTVQLDAMLANDDRSAKYDEFVDYLQSIGGYIEECTDTSMLLHFYGTLDNIDPQAAKVHIGNLRGDMYTEIPSGAKEKYKNVLEAVFIDRKYDILVASEICVYRGRGLDGRSEMRTKTHNGKTYLMNPHITKFNCFGGAESDITEALAHWDYFSAATYLNAQTSNLSFSDNTVMRTFGDWLFNNDQERFFRSREDGKELSFREMLEVV